MTDRGRPPKYETPEQMQEVIDRYFNKGGEGEESGAAWIQMGDAEMFAPTVEGLAYELGLSRQALLDYQKKDDFLDTIKRAKQKIGIALEQRLYGNNVTGIIFNLKNNFGWKDKTETEHSGQMTMNHRDVSDLTDEEIENELKSLGQ